MSAGSRAEGHGRPAGDARAGAMPRVLLTGFEPFGGEAQNPSAEVAAALDGRVIAGHRVATAVLPCAFSRASPALDAALARTAPALVLSLGLAGGRAELALERVALNLRDARIADNDGAQPLEGAVIDGAPPAYFGSLPVKAMVHGLRERGIPAALSLSAGTFVCNAVFFALMHRVAGRAGVRAGFMHLPYLPEQAARHPPAPGLALATMVQGVAAALEIALLTPDDLRVPGGSLF